MSIDFTRYYLKNKISIATLLVLWCICIVVGLTPAVAGRFLLGVDIGICSNIYFRPDCLSLRVSPPSPREYFINCYHRHQIVVVTHSRESIRQPAVEQVGGLGSDSTSTWRKRHMQRDVTRLNQPLENYLIIHIFNTMIFVI